MQAHRDKTEVPTSKLEKIIITGVLENSEIMTNFSLHCSQGNIVIFWADLIYFNRRCPTNPMFVTFRSFKKKSLWTIFNAQIGVFSHKRNSLINDVLLTWKYYSHISKVPHIKPGSAVFTRKSSKTFLWHH